MSESPRSKKNPLALLKNKKRRRKTIRINVDGETVKLVFQAVASRTLDSLQSDHPPTPEQRAEGAAWNRDTFPPALISACAVEPVISLEDATEIWTSDEWSTGELNHLFNTVSNLCMEGLDVSFTGSGSGTTQLSD